MSITKERVPINQTPVGPPEYLSHSSLSAYDFCPESWWLSKVAHVESEVRGSDMVGQAIHRVSETAGTEEDAEKVIEDILASTDDDAVVSDFEDVLRSVMNWDMTNPLDKRAETEVPIHGTIAGYRLRGEIDSIVDDPDGCRVIEDLKTTKRLPTPVSKLGYGDNESDPIYAARVTRQVMIYALMARSNGQRIDKVRMLYPRYQHVIEVDLRTERGKNLLIEAERFVKDNADRIKRSCLEGRVVATPTPRKCDSCNVRQHCTASMAST